MSLLQEISKQKLSGIISHPDAGKTTFTEKLLLFGGTIQEAGAVKSNKIKRSTSDFMEIERQREFLWQLQFWLLNIKERKSTFEHSLVTKILQKIHIERFYCGRFCNRSDRRNKRCGRNKPKNWWKFVELRKPMLVFINKLDREGKRCV